LKKAATSQSIRAIATKQPVKKFAASGVKKSGRRKFPGAGFSAHANSAAGHKRIFAYGANLDRSHMGGVERGERNLSFKKLCAIARALGRDVGSLTRGLPVPDRD
jgi:transcriptional regulator with XRE-family HTH domain